jgi:REP element-mobilizing transposase RayT
MARKLLVQYPGAIYHVMSRGDRREPIFLDDDDRVLFLKTLAEACAKTDYEVHAWCLLKNHFHLVIETPKANLVAGMKWFLGTYTSRFNRRHKLFGHLFSGRYKALVVDGSGNGYLKTVCDYVHLNPLRAKLLKPKARLRDYGWSSYGEYLKAAGKRPAWLRVDRLLGEWGIAKDSVAGRARFEEAMESRRTEALDFKPIRRGWCFGSPEFRQELLAAVDESSAGRVRGEERRESDGAKAERLLHEELERRHWSVKDLSQRRKGDGEKVAIAGRLRAETTMNWKWIAQKLSMGSTAYAADCVRQTNHE